MIEVLVYEDQAGRQPFAAWLRDQDRAAIGKVSTIIQRMAAGNMSEVKSVGGGVFERRIHWGPGYRIYFGRDGARLIVLLAGGTKKREQDDIEEAQSRWADYKRRKE